LTFGTFGTGVHAATRGSWNAVDDHSSDPDHPMVWEDPAVTTPLRIFLVDDHEVVRRGVRDMLEVEDDFEVVGEAGSVEEALHRIAATRPDVAAAVSIWLRP
jgi:PleD family two-component response regulator